MLQTADQLENKVTTTPFKNPNAAHHLITIWFGKSTRGSQALNIHRMDILRTSLVDSLLKIRINHWHSKPGGYHEIKFKKSEWAGKRAGAIGYLFVLCDYTAAGPEFTLEDNTDSHVLISSNFPTNLKFLAGALASWLHFKLASGANCLMQWRVWESHCPVYMRGQDLLRTSTVVTPWILQALKIFGL